MITLISSRAVTTRSKQAFKIGAHPGDANSVAAANSLTQKDHDSEAVNGEPGKLFWPVCIHEESECRLVRTPVSVPV